MACDPFFCGSVVSGLPTVISVSVRSDSAGRWMESSLLHLLEEVGSNSVGSAAVLAKLSEALFIEALRAVPNHGCYQRRAGRWPPLDWRSQLRQTVRPHGYGCLRILSCSLRTETRPTSIFVVPRGS